MPFQKIVLKPITIAVEPKLGYKRMSLIVEANWTFPLPLFNITRKVLLERSFDGRFFYPVHSCAVCSMQRILFKEYFSGYEKVISYRIKLITDYDLEIVSPVGMYINK